MGNNGLETAMMKPDKPVGESPNRLRGSSRLNQTKSTLNTSNGSILDEEREPGETDKKAADIPGHSPQTRLRAPVGLEHVRLSDLQDNLACPRYLHDHLRAIWYSPDLKRRMCYYCAESSTDSGYKLIGGFPEIEPLTDWISKASTDSVLYKLNTGHEVVLDLAILRCPCGTPFQSSPQSAICSMCCTATCSAACHRTHVQDEGMCVYHFNFIPEARPEIFGSRDIRWCVIERSAPGTYLSRVCGPRYLEAISGQDQNHLLLRRGYCHYGQPLDATVAAMKPLPRDVQRPLHAFRRNMCQCNVCRSRQPHAVLHAQCDETRPDPASELSAAQYAQMAALPAAHPLAVASRIGNPAIEDGRKKKGGARPAEGRDDGHEGGERTASDRPGHRERPSPVAHKGGRAQAADAPSRVKRHIGSTPAGKDAVVPDEEVEEG